MECPKCGYSHHDNSQDNICYDCQLPKARCICNDEQEIDLRCDDYECEECGGVDGNHSYHCSHDISSFGHLIKHGYD